MYNIMYIVHYLYYKLPFNLCYWLEMSNSCPNLRFCLSTLYDNVTTNNYILKLIGDELASGISAINV